jgi:hypothetical protein
MKQHQPALSRLPGLEKQKKEKKKKKLSPPLTSRFLHQIVTSHSQTKQKITYSIIFLSSPSLNTFIFAISP